jgi:uncharacterized protein YrrD
MVHLSVDAKIACADGSGGQATCVIIDPADQKMTHLVVREKQFPHTERLVSVDQIAEIAPDLIRLHCTRDELATVEPFVEYHDVRSERPCYREGAEFYLVMRDVIWPKKTVFVPTRSERIPAGELAVRRGAQVEAIDGPVGHVCEFLMSSLNEPITHMVVKERVFWHQKERIVPVSEIDRLGEQIIYLKLDKRAIESLPARPMSDC